MDETLFHDNILAHKPGLFLSRILYGLFKRVTVDEGVKEDLRRMNRQGTVVYAIKYRGRLDYLMYHYNFRMKRLPYPRLAFDLDISLLLPLGKFLRTMVAKAVYTLKNGEPPDPYRLGFYREAIRSGTTSMIFLVDPKRFVRRFVHSEKDHLQLLLETQQTMDRPVFIVPQFVLYQRTPEREYKSFGGILFGYKDNPGLIRKTVLFFRHNRRAFIDFGKPVNLMEYLRSQPSSRPVEDMAVGLRERLVESIDNQRRIILGPIMKSRQQLKEIVLRDAGVKSQIEKAASGRPKLIRQSRKKAGEYFDEIAADLNIAYIQFFHLALTWFWKKLFEGIEVDMESLAKVREWARKGTLIYVPSHKSHIDYLVINYILHNYNMHIPRVAAGRNLAFWPMGHIFRKSGAFFIRRTFKGARLYQEVFNRYIKALIEEGHPLEFFIEGGRSRSGKVILPKIGFLAILLQAFEEGYCKDLIFVPASITYDKILEEKAFVRELEGGEKEKENLKQFIRARHFLKRRYGKIYIRFAEPVSLKEYLEGNPPQTNGKPHEHLAMHLI
ncbi:MAG: 1-acyl-sn-glycerol-3-phosphate acyltransferase, partial [Desulfobacteraceae bacterium]